MAYQISNIISTLLILYFQYCNQRNLPYLTKYNRKTLTYNSLTSFSILTFQTTFNIRYINCIHVFWYFDLWNAYVPHNVSYSRSNFVTLMFIHYHCNTSNVSLINRPYCYLMKIMMIMLWLHILCCPVSSSDVLIIDT